jgi:hypothetical protein
MHATAARPESTPTAAQLIAASKSLTHIATRIIIVLDSATRPE